MTTRGEPEGRSVVTSTDLGVKSALFAAHCDGGCAAQWRAMAHEDPHRCVAGEQVLHEWFADERFAGILRRNTQRRRIDQRAPFCA